MLRETPKWGGSLLRAPAAAPLLARGVPLASICRAGSYLITGNDRFFYRTTPDGIDPACLRPIVKSTRGEHRIALDGAPSRWLVSASDPALLGADGERAVAEGVPQLSGVRARRVWSQIDQEPGAVLCVRTARDRHLAYLNPQAWASGELYRLWPPDGVSPAALAAFLNSAVAGLQLEALGRAYGGGGGPLKVERADLVQLRVPDVERLRAASADLAAALEPLLRRPIGTVPEEREQSDRARARASLRPPPGSQRGRDGGGPRRPRSRGRGPRRPSPQGARRRPCVTDGARTVTKRHEPRAEVCRREHSVPGTERSTRHETRAPAPPTRRAHVSPGLAPSDHRCRKPREV